MDRDRPGQAQGKLREGTEHLRLNLPCLVIERVASILPYVALYVDGLRVACAEHLDGVGIEVGDVANAPIVVSSFRVVLDKHHLRTLFQLQFLVRREVGRRKLTTYLGSVAEGSPTERVELRLVVVVGHAVVRCQADVA